MLWRYCGQQHITLETVCYFLLKRTIFRMELLHLPNMFFSLCEYIAFVCILYFHIRFMLCALSISVLSIPTVTAIMTPLKGQPSTAAFISKHQRISFTCHAYLMLVHNYSSEVILPCVDFSEDILMSLFHARLYFWHISNTVTFTVCITIHCSPLTT